VKSESRACGLRNCVISFDYNPSSNLLLSAVSRCSIVAVGQPSLCNIRNACSYSTRVSFSFWRRASKRLIDSLGPSNIPKRRASADQISLYASSDFSLTSLRISDAGFSSEIVRYLLSVRYPSVYCCNPFEVFLITFPGSIPRICFLHLHLTYNDNRLLLC